MASTSYLTPISRITKDMTATLTVDYTITGMRWFGIRCRLAFWFIRLGAKILPIETSVVTRSR